MFKVLTYKGSTYIISKYVFSIPTYLIRIQRKGQDKCLCFINSKDYVTTKFTGSLNFKERLKGLGYTLNIILCLLVLILSQ